MNTQRKIKLCKVLTQLDDDMKLLASAVELQGHTSPHEHPCPSDPHTQVKNVDETGTRIFLGGIVQLAKHCLAICNAIVLRTEIALTG